MNDEQIQTTLEMYERLFQSRDIPSKKFNTADSGPMPGQMGAHAHYLIGRVRENLAQGDRDSAMKKLGWIQATLCFLSLATVDELKTHT